MNQPPSAFCDSPEDLLVKTADWLEQVADDGTPVSAIRVLDKVRPVVDALRKERSDRSTTAGLLRDMNTDVGAALADRDSWKALAVQAQGDLAAQAGVLARPSVRLCLWLGRVLFFWRRGR